MGLKNTKPFAGEAALKPFNGFRAVRGNDYTKPFAGEAALKLPPLCLRAFWMPILNPLQAKQH